MKYWTKAQSRGFPFSTFLLFLLAQVPQSGAAADWVPDTYPWINVDRVFGAAVRAGRIVPVTPNPTWGMTPKDGGVYYMGSDVSGWARSLDSVNFENANSGRVFSTMVCGGCSTAENWFNASENAQGYGQVCSPGASPARAWVDSGPPSVRLDYPSQLTAS